MNEYRDGEPCSHIGCERHMTHPCEYCGRINAQGEVRKFDWMVEAIEKAKEGDNDKALDLIYDNLDDMLIDGEYDKMNRFFDELDTYDYNDCILFGVLTVTYCAEEHLPSREKFINRKLKGTKFYKKYSHMMILK